MADELAEVRALKTRHSRDLLSRPGVSGVGVEQDSTGRFRLTVHLDSERPDSRDGLPDEIEGHPVRYLWTGPFRAQGAGE